MWKSGLKQLTVQSLCILQKRAISTVHNVGCSEHTNIQLLKTHAMKFINLVKLKVTIIMFKARFKVCFLKGVVWGVIICITYYIRVCISVNGVGLWNELGDILGEERLCMCGF